MKYSKLEYYASQPRLDRYLTACGQSKAKAQHLYRINVRVSQSFYPILNLFETFVRNSFNYRIAGYFADPNWIINQKNGFMSDNSLSRSRFYLKNKVQYAERMIRRKGGSVTPGKVIAEQSFGFWTSLFDPHHYRLIGGVVIQTFQHKPTHINRSIISQKLNEIRKFRNRVYHNEPICFDNSHIDFTKAEEVKDDIYKLLSWIDTELSGYVSYFDSIDNKINSVNHL